MRHSRAVISAPLLVHDYLEKSRPFPQDMNIAGREPVQYVGTMVEDYIGSVSQVLSTYYTLYRILSLRALLL